jgi:hypothetical protein
VKYPKDVNLFAETMHNSSRSYRNIVITRSNHHDGRQYDPKNIFASIVSTIKNLELNWIGYHGATSEALQAKMQEAHIEPDRTMLRVEVILRRNQENLRAREAFPVYARRHEAIDDDDRDDDVMPEIRFQAVGNDREREAFRTIQERASIIQGLRSEIKKEYLQEFAAILKQFTDLETFKMSNVTNLDIPTDFDPLNNLSTVRKLDMWRCDLSVCSNFVKPCTNLNSLSVVDPINLVTFMNMTQRDGFEFFLISLENLKELTMKNVRGFFRENREVKFKLCFLKFNEVFFTNQAAAEKFFSSQDQLKTIDLQLKNEFTRHLNLEDMVPAIRFDTILKISKFNINFYQFFISRLIF